MYRTVPPRIKVYEALGCIGDRRIQLISHTEAKISSSSGNKIYTVRSDAKHRSLMMNDNGAYRKGYLGYTGIAYLMITGELPFDGSFADALKNIAWKDINSKYKNNFELTQKYVDGILIEKGIDMDVFTAFIDSVLATIYGNTFSYFGKKILPPEGY